MTSESSKKELPSEILPPLLNCIAANVQQCPGYEDQTKHKVRYSKIHPRSGIPYARQRSIPRGQGCLRMLPFIPHIDILLFPSQFISDRDYDRFQFQPLQGTSSQAGRFRFALTVHANL